MSIYLNAAAMLAALLAAFLLLARLLQAMRAGQLPRLWNRDGSLPPSAAAARLAVEQTCMIDGKRRLLLVRCDEQRVLLMTGGPADLVVALLPAVGAAS